MTLRPIPPKIRRRLPAGFVTPARPSVTTIRVVMPSSYDPAAWQNFYVMMGTVIAAIVLTPQTRELMGAEILVLNVIFLGLNIRNRVSTTPSRSALLSLLIR